MIANYARGKAVHILQSSIIYRLIEDVESMLSEKLPPLITHRVTGEAEILVVFPIRNKKKITPVAGCRVKLGSMTKLSKCKVKRQNEVIHTGIHLLPLDLDGASYKKGLYLH